MQRLDSLMRKEIFDKGDELLPYKKKNWSYISTYSFYQIILKFLIHQFVNSSHSQDYSNDSYTKIIEHACFFFLSELNMSDDMY